MSSVVPLADVSITERELRHLAAAWLASPGNAPIDFEVFAILTGHPNTTNARKRFGEIKKRVRDQVFSGNGETPVSVPSTPQKRKTKTNSDQTPSSAKKRKAASKGKEAEENKENGQNEGKENTVKKETEENSLLTDFGL